MRLLITSICLATLCVASPTTVRSSQGRYIRKYGPVASRRQAVSYVTNVIHQDPKNPDSRAQSTINVQFAPSIGSGRNPQYYQSSLYPHQVNQYYQNESPQKDTKPSKSQNTIKSQEPQSAQHSEANQSQLFNVGYSVRFTNSATPKTRTIPSTKSSQRTKKLSEGEIITGTRKKNERVNAPDLNTAAQEFNSFVNKAHHKISGIKFKEPVQTTTTSAPDVKTILAQANLSPITQQYFYQLEKAQSKEQRGEQSARKQQEINQNEPKIKGNLQQDQKASQSKSAWQSLGPNVEIYQSTEVASTVDITPQESAKPRYFDHAYALGKSEGFDYTNVVDVNGNSIQDNQNQKQFRIVQNQQSEGIQGIQKVAAIDPQTSTLQQLSGTLQTSFPSFQQVPATIQPTPATVSQAVPLASSFQQSLPSPSLPNPFYSQLAVYQSATPGVEVPKVIPTSNIHNPQIGLMLPPITNGNPNAQLPSNLFQAAPRFPVDMRLVREPVLTTDTRKTSESPNVIPIHFDTRLLQEMQQKLNTYQSLSEVPIASQAQQLKQFTSPFELSGHSFQNVFFQKYDTPQLAQYQQASGSSKNEDFEPYFPSQQSLYTTVKPQTEIVQQQNYEQQKENSNNINNVDSFLNGFTQFKIYGKPQPIGQVHDNLSFKNNMLSVDQKSSNGQRQPRYRQTDYKLGTDLRPPPLPSQGSYQKRLYLV